MRILVWWEENGIKKPLGKDIHLGRRIILRSVVNENIHLVLTYWHRIKLLRTLSFQEMWGIS